MSDGIPLKDKPLTAATKTTRIVHWLQSIRVRRNNVPLISGLDSVVFGNMAASECVLLYNVKPPQYLWYMLSGGICDVLQFLMDFCMHFWVHNSSICWAVCFTTSIIFRHSTHRYLVFGKYVGGYWNSLLRMYCGYSVSIVLSTAFNMIVTRTASVGHYAAFVFSLLWTGIVNFFILKKLWSFSGNGKSGKASPRLNGAAAGDVELATTMVEEEDRLTR